MYKPLMLLILYCHTYQQKFLEKSHSDCGTVFGIQDASLLRYSYTNMNNK